MRINWAKAALNIRQAGKPLQVASRELGMGTGVLGQISRGEITEPRFSAGMAILDYHCDVCGADKTRELAA